MVEDARSTPETDPVGFTILMPCLNEAETLARCIQKAHDACHEAGVTYEVLVADNGSSDGSQAIARAHGARIVDVPVRGYGAALRAGMQAARGEFVVMADSDDSYDFAETPGFIGRLRQGYQLVMGTRLRGEIKRGAMPFLHRRLGNPILTAIGNLFFRCGLSDYHCGFRGFDRAAVTALGLRSNGMEFASEMVIKATLAKLRTAEIPVTYWRDGRSTRPHLRTWRDGWRHLRLMLLYSPRWLFLYPSIAMILFGLLCFVALLPGPLKLHSTVFDVHTLLVGAFSLLLGTQVALTALFLRLFAARAGMLPMTTLLSMLSRHFSLEVGLVLGIVVAVAGLAIDLSGVWLWRDLGFGALNYEYTLRVVTTGSTLIALAVQVFFSSFVISLLELVETG